VCRKCYIHPAVLSGFEDGTLPPMLESLAAHPPRGAGLNADERLTLAFLVRTTRARPKASRSRVRSSM
jgi:DNA topoisomerase-1